MVWLYVFEKLTQELTAALLSMKRIFTRSKHTSIFLHLKTLFISETARLDFPKEKPAIQTSGVRLAFQNS